MIPMGRIADRLARRAGGPPLLALAVAVASGAGARGDDAPAAAGAAVRADAGDDQIGLVGRRVTLNGGGSAPRGATFRWFLLSGPKIEKPSQEGCFFSFVPTAAGTYRLGLVVAADRDGAAVVSEVDEATVTVGEVPSAVVAGGAPSLTTAAIDQMLAGPGAAAGRSTLEQAAGALESVSSRVPLYTSFADLSAELARRLDVVVPTDPEWRRYWTEAVFGPLTQHVVAEMRQTGLDLRSPQGQVQPLGQAQQEQLQRLLASYAKEFRTRARVR